MATKKHHDLMVQLFAGTEITRLHGRQRPPAGVRAKQVAALPLIVGQPQWVRFADRLFSLRREGLYRFWDWGLASWRSAVDCPRSLTQTFQYGSVILYRGDILKLLAAIATLHVHGTAHHGLSFAEKLAQAKRGILSLTCGVTAKFCCELLTTFGWRARTVSSIRIAGEWNTYDNGHDLLEFYWPARGKWVLADVDAGQMFMADGEYLNAGEIAALLDRDLAFDLAPLTFRGGLRIDSSQAVAGEFCGYEMFCEQFTDPELARAWYRRVLATPIIDDQGTRYARVGRRHQRIMRYPLAGLAAMAPAAWQSKFYGASD